MNTQQQTYKVIIIFQTSPTAWTSKSRFVQANTPHQAALKARLQMHAPENSTVARVEVH